VPDKEIALKSQPYFPEGVEGNMNKLLFTFAISLVMFALPALGLATADVQHLNAAGQCIKSKNYHEAYTRFKVMGDRGCLFSNSILGMMCQKGRGVDKSIPTALSYYQKSASKGFRDAELRLGRLYDSGEVGLQRNAQAAAHWFERAAVHGVAEAQLKLGKMYLKGDGVREESFKAKIWLKKAADQGETEASQLLSKIPGEPAATQNVKGLLANSGADYEEGWTNIEKSWEGYADVAKMLDSAAGTAK
jgi:TPR repeat protein